MGKIRINQMGYHPNGEKQVCYIGQADNFQILRELDQTVVYEGVFEELQYDVASGDHVCRGSFTNLKKEGHYYIVVREEKSRVFSINSKGIETCNDALLKAFYYQRCGVALEEKYAGHWKHTACHLQKSRLFHPDNEKAVEMMEIETSGGWHDAGDYGRYTVPAAKAVADLMLSYEMFERAFQHTIDIPESKLPGADILHEVKFELEFMLKMQRSSDGAVYTKVTTRFFPGMVMPEVDLDPLYIFEVSSPATADFAASMAMAARVFRSFDPIFADQCLCAALLAYDWLEKNLKPLLFINPENMNSGEYGDDFDLDERYWAAAELYRTTGEERFHKDFINYYKRNEELLNLGWTNVSGYGSIAYLFANRNKNAEVFDTLKNLWIKQADVFKELSLSDGYGITLTKDQYIWGSMMILLNESMHLIIAEQLLNERRYTTMIQRNWDYLFGINPMDISYVTGLGDQSVLNPHHRPSAADGVAAPVPGLVSGGPCAGLYDDVAQEYLQNQPPAKCFIDHVESYSTNEITVYWNSPAVFVGAYLYTVLM